MSADDSSYPMKFDDAEKDRLEKQAQILAEPSLGVLLRKSERCLEIGCGIGSNLPMVRSENSNIDYFGIDINVEALETARRNHSKTLKSKFEIMDGRNIQFPADSFDLVISRLTLWSVGRDWGKVVEEARRVLKSGGIFYSYEPDDRFLLFFPKKDAAMNLIQKWQVRVTSDGLNPFIGIEILSKMQEVGFSAAETRLDTKVTTGDKKDQYQACAENLRGIFTKNGPEFIGMGKNSREWQVGMKQLMESNKSSIIVEGYFVSQGVK